jgi:hypothetical protein
MPTALVTIGGHIWIVGGLEGAATYGATSLVSIVDDILILELDGV